MTKRFSIASLVLAMLVFNVALLLALASPSIAGERAKGGKHASTETSSDHDGDADSDSSTQDTEDNDSNDGGTPNNIPDDGDNAHPSGKDRSVEHGKATKNPNQGKAESNPDDSKGPMRYEGELGDDKPNGPGGNDLADQDGNNGCGNDDDFDDDNNGHCGKPKSTTPPCTDDMETEQDECNPTTDTPGDDVLDGVLNRPATGGDEVAPNALDRPGVLGAVLPFTGGDVAALFAAAIGMILSGLTILKLRSRSATK